MAQSAISIAMDDLREGMARPGLAWHLAIEDLRDRYRRSYLGLAWIMLAFLGFIAVKALVFAGLFQDEEYDFFSHLVIGFSLFSFMAIVVPGAANLFITSRTWILSTSLPYSLYANTLIARAFAELGFLAIGAVVLIALMGNVQPANVWTAIPALFAYYLTALGLCLLLAPIGARFRDLVYAIQTVMRMIFFATPIIWVATPDTLRGVIAQWNPLTYYIDIIRQPLMTGTVPLQAWAVVAIITVVILGAGVFVFGLTKKRVPMWL